MMAGMCRALAVAPQTLLLYLAAMFGQALLLMSTIARWPLHWLAMACTLLLAWLALAWMRPRHEPITAHRE